MSVDVEAPQSTRPFPELFPIERHWCDYTFAAKYSPGKTGDLWTGAYEEIDSGDLLIFKASPTCYDFKAGIMAFPRAERNFETSFGWVVRPTARNIQRLIDLLTRTGFVVTERALELMKRRWEEREGARPKGRTKLDEKLLRGATALVTAGEKVRAHYVGSQFPQGEVLISNRVTRVGSEYQPFVRDPETGAHSQQPIPPHDLDLDADTAERCEDAYEHYRNEAAQKAIRHNRALSPRGRTFQL